MTTSAAFRAHTVLLETFNLVLSDYFNKPSYNLTDLILKKIVLQISLRPIYERFPHIKMLGFWQYIVTYTHTHAHTRGAKGLIVPWQTNHVCSPGADVFYKSILSLIKIGLTMVFRSWVLHHWLIQQRLLLTMKCVSDGLVHTKSGMLTDVAERNSDITSSEGKLGSKVAFLSILSSSLSSLNLKRLMSYQFLMSCCIYILETLRRAITCTFFNAE